jgi:hypothetical protein
LEIPELIGQDQRYEDSWYEDIENMGRTGTRDQEFLARGTSRKTSQEKSRNTCLIPLRASRAKIRLRTTSKTSTGRSWASQQLSSRHGAPGKERNKTTLGGAHFEEAGRLGGRLGGRRAVRSDLLERGRRGEGTQTSRHAPRGSGSARGPAGRLAGRSGGSRAVRLGPPGCGRQGEREGG